MFENPVVIAKRKGEIEFSSYIIHRGGYTYFELNVPKLYGVGVVGGHMLIHDSDVEFLSGNHQRFDWKESSGAFSITLREGSDYYILPDPVGSCFTYYYKKSGFIAASSDLGALISWLKLNGVSVSKSIFYQAMLATVSDGCFSQTSYENVYTLNSGEFISFKNGEMVFKSYGLDEFLMGDFSYSECFTEAVSSLKKNVSAASKNESLNKICHLTGGLDSRLAVSVLDGSNVLDSWNIYCSGSKGHPDFDTAYNLSGILPAVMTQDSGLHVERTPTNLSDLYSWQSDACCGMIANMPINTGLAQRKNTIVLSGGYGECYRGYWLNATNKEKDDIPKIIWGVDSSRSEDNICSSEVDLFLEKQFSSFFEEKKDIGWNGYDVMQLLYLQHKNRYFVGNIALNFSKYTARYDPLYSLHGFKLAYSASNWYRSNKGVMYDLMNHFSPVLASLPFGTTSWPEELLTCKKINDVSWPLEIPDPKVVSGSNPSIIESTLKFSGNSDPIPAGVPVWQWNSYQAAQEECLQLLEGRNEFYEVFNKKITHRLLKNKLKNRIHIRQVFIILYALRWLYG